MRFEIENLQLFGLDLSALFKRWLHGMRDIIPAGLSAAFLRPAPRVEARVIGQQLDIVQIDASGRRTTVACLDEEYLDVALDHSLRADVIRNVKSPRMLQVKLLMPESQIMRRTLTLPYLARHNLRDVVAFQVNRLTPFSVDQLFYDVQLLQEHPELGTIEVELIAVLKTVAQPWIDHLERLTGSTVEGLGVHCESESAQPCNLFGKSRISGQWWRRLNHNGILLIVLTAALLAVAVTPVYKARTLVLERKQEITRLNEQVVGLLDVRNRLDAELLPLNDFIKYRGQYAMPNQVISELSRVVSHNIYLTNLTMQDGTVTISGTGTSVIDLIEQINSSPFFSDAKFTSSLNRNARTEQDQFTAMFSLRNVGEET
ncbi:MAG: PilN domain-containing protein [Pseudomonas sp.]|nr:PilN domain-containing protein [Pseudomonas sp.]MDY0415579.1 PilN domain-containing protein [Pseudomonas sp.]